MTFVAAVMLVELIARDYPRLRVIAIGHFLPIEDLQSDSPWLVSVVVPGHERPIVLRSPNDLKRFEPKAEPRIARTPRPKPETQHTLFD